MARLEAEKTENGGATSRFGATISGLEIWDFCVIEQWIEEEREERLGKEFFSFLIFLILFSVRVKGIEVWVCLILIKNIAYIVV